MTDCPPIAILNECPSMSLKGGKWSHKHSFETSINIDGYMIGE